MNKTLRTTAIAAAFLAAGCGPKPEVELVYTSTNCTHTTQSSETSTDEGTYIHTDGDTFAALLDYYGEEKIESEIEDMIHNTYGDSPLWNPKNLEELDSINKRTGENLTLRERLVDGTIRNIYAPLPAPAKGPSFVGEVMSLYN